MWQEAKNYIYLPLNHILKNIDSFHEYLLTTNYDQPLFLVWDTGMNISDKDHSLPEATFKWMKQSNKYQKTNRQKTHQPKKQKMKLSLQIILSARKKIKLGNMINSDYEVLV